MIKQIHINLDQILAIQDAYTKEVAENLGHLRPSEEKQLEDALKAISEEETRTARLYTIGKITDEVWDSLWQEWQDKRRSNQISLVSLYRQHKARIEDLDPARFGTIVNMVLLPPFAYLKHISDQVKAKEMQAVVGRNKKSSRLATASQCSEYVSVCSP